MQQSPIEVGFGVISASEQLARLRRLRGGKDLKPAGSTEISSLTIGGILF